MTNFTQLLRIEAAKWLGTPYRHLGKTKNGCDCLGLFIGIFTNLNIQMPDTVNTKYSKNWNISQPNFYENNIKHYCTPLNKIKKPGDLCSFKINNTGINHIGIWLYENEFIHACALNDIDTVISDIRDTFWKKHFAGNWRVKLLSEYL